MTNAFISSLIQKIMVNWLSKSMRKTSTSPQTSEFLMSIPHIMRLEIPTNNSSSVQPKMHSNQSQNQVKLCSKELIKILLCTMIRAFQDNNSNMTKTKKPSGTWHQRM
jgi:hypothetical protein